LALGRGWEAAEGWPCPFGGLQGTCGTCHSCKDSNSLVLFFAVLGFELRTFTLSHSASPVFMRYFWRQGLVNYCPRLASNRDPPDLCLPGSWDYRRVHTAQASC
jgi:hypothetical protein